MREYDNKAGQILSIASIQNLESVSENHPSGVEFDFSSRTGSIGVDTETFEVPATISVNSFILVKMPNPYESGFYDDNIALKYYNTSLAFCGVQKPDYTIGYKNGFAEYFMWCKHA